MTGVIAKHEFIFTVKRLSYLIVTFGMPVILLAYAGFIALITLAAVPSVTKSLQKDTGVVDQTGLLKEAREAAVPSAESERANTEPSKFDLEALAEKMASKQKLAWLENLKYFDDLESAQNALLDESIENVLVIPEDFIESGEIRQYTRKWSLFGSTGPPAMLAGRLADGIMHRRGLSAEEISRTRGQPSVTLYEYDPSGRFTEVNLLAKGLNFGLPLGVAGILILSLLINAGFLVAAIAEEKENKVIEVLLSSVRPEQLLLGKVLGLGAAALLQITIWLAMAGFFPFLLMAALQQTVDLDINVTHLLVSALFFPLGFIFYGALLVGLGSLGSTQKESQQLSVLVILPPVVPLVTFVAMIDAPNGWLARIMSWIPLFSPTAMMLRLGTGEVPWWDVGLSLILLIAGIFLAVFFSARLFRIGTLLYGKTPNPITIIRMLFQAG